MISVSFFLFFFFKQKTAYEMRISDWSSDVCSSDLESRAAQSGPVSYVTSDAAGNLALADFGPGDIAGIRFDLDRVRRDARAGTAAAMAMGYAPMPSVPGRTSYALNGSTFREAQAIGGAISHRLDTDNPFALTAGFAYAGHGNNAVRLGVAGDRKRTRLNS